MIKEKFLTCADIGEILEVSSQAVLNWVTDGRVDKRLKCYRIASRYRIKPEALVEFLVSRNNSPDMMIEFKQKIQSFLDKK